MKKVKETDLVIEKENQNQIRELEQFYTQGQVDNLFENIKEKKEQMVQDMIKYAQQHEVECKWTKDGDPIDYEVKMNPIVISNYFFKPIIPFATQEPIYNAEKLGMVFDYYCELISEVNDKIGNFPSSLTLFCKFAGITLQTLRNYRNSDDYNMRIVTEKIYDQVSDENITMSQVGMVREKTTLFKMKSQNEIVEKAQPNVNISVKTIEPADIDRISERLRQYSYYSKKKGK
jgi:hypothetical protein